MALQDIGKGFSKLLTRSLSDFNPFRGEESYLAADIGSATIKLLEVRGVGDNLRIIAFGSLPTPPGAVQSNTISDQQAVAEILKALVESKKMKARKVITCIPGPAVIIKRMQLPKRDD